MTELALESWPEMPVGARLGCVEESEVRGLGRLVGQMVGEVAGWVEEVHEVVAARVFGPLGVLGAPVLVAHDSVSRGAYAAVGGVARAAGDSGGALLAPLARGAPLATSSGGAQVLALLDAFVGDRLDADGSPLALPMALRCGGRDVIPDRDRLEAGFAGATGRLVVFVHGLAETDLAWVGRDDEGRPWSYAHALEPHGWTGALVRYNTGRHIAANGMLGSPHHGATLEQGVNVVGRLLGHLTGARPIAALLRPRSAGIQDLRHGLFTAGEDDALVGHSGPVLLATSRHHLVAAHLGSSERHPAAVFFGDLMVRPGSALGMGNRRSMAMEPCERETFPTTTHQGLLKDRRIAEALIGWLA